MKLQCFEVTPSELDYLKANISGLDLSCEEKRVQDIWGSDEDVNLLCIFAGSLINYEALQKFPNLQFITTRSTGYDHIDLTACQKNGVAVANVPSYSEQSVAEFVFGLILALSRKIYLGANRVKQSNLFSNQGLMGFDLKGKTIGILGTGRIGRGLIPIARSFGMNVLAHDIQPDNMAALELGMVYVPLEKLLTDSDVVSIHLPYLSSTHHLVNADRLKLMKPTALLINASRGGIVDSRALLAALEEGIIGGAGLDVLEEEGHIKDEYSFLRHDHPRAEELKYLLAKHALAKMPNVLITPHMAFNTSESAHRVLATTVDNIKAFIGGKAQNLVF